jgi:hypothetical protein
MRLSELTESGELPLGVHRASLRETLVRFAVGHAQRVAGGQRLERIYHVAAEDGASSRLSSRRSIACSSKSANT